MVDLGRPSRRVFLLGAFAATLAACEPVGSGAPARTPADAGGSIAPEPAPLSPQHRSGGGGPEAPPSQATPPPSALAPVELAWQADGGPDGLRCPTGLAVDGQGALTVVDAGRDRLVRLSDVGKPLGVWGGAGAHPGAFRFLLPPEPEADAPCLAGGGVAADPGDGSTVVVDLAGIWRLDRAGRVVAAWADAGPEGGRLALPAGVAIDGRTGQIYVADTGAGRVHKYDRTGRWLLTWGGPGAVVRPAAVVVDGRGRVYVADYGVNRIQAFDGDGRPLAAWGGYGAGPGEFIAPRGVAVDRAGRVYVVDAQRVQVFTDAGALLAAWPIGGGSLAVPGGIAVDARGLVSVTDWGRGLILQFRPRGQWPVVEAAPTPRPTATPRPLVTAIPPWFVTPTDR
jgi:sugar lactone lactonase YvrE